MSRPKGSVTAQTLAAQRRERAWQALVALDGGRGLNEVLVREVRRRHQFMVARARASARCKGDLTDAIESVVDDLKAGRL